MLASEDCEGVCWFDFQGCLASNECPQSCSDFEQMVEEGDLGCAISEITGCGPDEDEDTNCNPNGGDRITITFDGECSTSLNFLEPNPEDPNPEAPESYATPVRVEMRFTRGNELCYDVGRVSETELTCTLPSGRENNVGVVVTHGSKVYTRFEALSYEECLEGTVPSTEADSIVCVTCPAGKFAKGGAATCSECPSRTYSFAGDSECRPCPQTQGITCAGGKLEAVDGFWAAAMQPRADGTIDSAAFIGDSDFSDQIFPCFSAEGEAKDASCMANELDFASATHASVTPATVYRCAAGHRGVLCAACEDGYFFKDSMCRNCETSKEWISAATITAIACFFVFLLAYAAYRYLTLKHEPFLRAVLRRLRRRVRAERKHRRRRRRLALRRLRLLRLADAGLRDTTLELAVARDERGVAAGRAAGAGADASLLARWRVDTQALMIKGIHSSLNSAKKGIVHLSESVRIVLNLCKVVTHLARVPTRTFRRRSFYVEWCDLTYSVYFAVQRRADLLLALAVRDERARGHLRLLRVRRLRRRAARGLLRHRLRPARQLFAEHFFRSERTALHSYGPDPHSC